MTKKKLWFASLCCVAGLSFAACSNESGKYTEEEENNQNQNAECETSYKMTLSGAVNCNDSGICKMTYEDGGMNSIMIALSATSKESVDSNGNACPNGPAKNVKVSISSDEAISINDDGNNTSMETNDSFGTAVFTVAPGEAENSAVITISTDKDHGSLSQSIFVTIPTQVEPKPQTVDLSIKLAYSGNQALTSSDVLLFKDKTCAEILASSNDPLTRGEVLGLQKTASNSKADYSSEVNGASFSFSYGVEEMEGVTFAVVGRGAEGSAFVAYGCTDGLSADKTSVNVVLKDAMSSQDEHDLLCESKDCSLVTKNTDENYLFCFTNGCIDEIPTVNGVYTGIYRLQSQFNALSLLPHSGTNDFTTMLAGDWIQWSLDLLAHPEQKVPAIVFDQLLPLILNAPWLTELLNKLGVGDGILAFLSPDMINSLLDSFGVKKIIVDSLNQLLSQLTWWDTASSVITLVNEITTNFTLSGYLLINAEPNDSDMLVSNIHSYDSLLYNTGKFDCYFGDSYGKDNNQDNICRVKLSTLDQSFGESHSEYVGSVYGSFKAELNDCDDDGICKSASIYSHSLQLAYGKLIYGVLMQFLPQLLESLGAGSAKEIHSIGTLIEYYAGFGLVKAWNSHATSWNEDHAAEIESGESKPLALIDETTTTSCNAIATAATKFVGSWVASSLPSFAGVAETFLQPALLTPLCSNGIAKLDALIDSKLSNITAGTDAVQFMTPNDKPCKINFGALEANGDRVLESFGMTDYTWGQTTDNRCDWIMSIKTADENKTLKVEGKFFAPRVNED